MNTLSKPDIVNNLDKAFADTVAWYESQSDENFNKELVEGKWTMAGHLYHLIKSTKAVSKGMGMPKLMLRMTFGVNNRSERSYAEQHQKYKDDLAKVLESTGQGAQPGQDFYPQKGREFDKADLIKRFLFEKDSFIEVFNKQSDKDLAKFVLPHPLMGKLNFREMAYFTTFHTKHHLENLKENYTSV